MTTKKRIAVLTSGGDAQGMNAAVRAVVRTSLDRGADVYAIYEGYQGMVEGGERIRAMDWDSVGGILQLGGTIIGTARSEEFMTREGRRTAAKNLIQNGIDGLIVIGGDDSIGLSSALYKYGNINVCACPKTIDNDIKETDFTFGFLTAGQILVDTLVRLITTAHSQRMIYLIEVQGRDAGWLTLYGGLTAGVDIILIPEIDFDYQRDIVDVLKNRVRLNQKSHVILCSEGAFPNQESLNRDFYELYSDNLNVAKTIEVKLRNNTELKDYFIKFDANYEIHLTSLDVSIQVGNPNVFDRILGLRVGYHAMNNILEKNYAKISCLKNSEQSFIPS